MAIFDAFLKIEGIEGEIKEESRSRAAAGAFQQHREHHGSRSGRWQGSVLECLVHGAAR
jgi:hypothetical protein